jgi:Protein of unknown function (DUF1501)
MVGPPQELDDQDERGMLYETLVVWTGEMGRTPRVSQSVVGGASAGRDGQAVAHRCSKTDTSPLS